MNRIAFETCAVNDVSAMLNSGHTPDWTGPTVERVMSNGERVFALAFRRWLVEQARQPGASVEGQGLRHGINANQLRRWMPAVNAQPPCTA